MSAAMKPTAPPVGRGYEDDLSTEKLRALLDVEGADVSAGTVEEVRACLHQRIDAVAERNRRS